MNKTGWLPKKSFGSLVNSAVDILERKMGGIISYGQIRKIFSIEDSTPALQIYKY